ncbi:hypothetical protein [Ramlibacter sp.]|uniref:hypothetical protein n=1 Tax=Ramlibacter sp. TaxID=1917967 RepID=UPI002BA1420F|nr:hypothetical protein [Ramlibacter sp.]HWI81405.1 hypothetical protein [Ramlibacter sp.]
MHVAERKMNEWHRLNNALGAAQQQLAIAGRCGVADERIRTRLQSQVARIQRESDAALRALRAAVEASRAASQ